MPAPSGSRRNRRRRSSPVEALPAGAAAVAEYLGAPESAWRGDRLPWARSRRPAKRRSYAPGTCRRGASREPADDLLEPVGDPTAGAWAPPDQVGNHQLAARGVVLAVGPLAAPERRRRRGVALRTRSSGASGQEASISTLGADHRLKGAVKSSGNRGPFFAQASAPDAGRPPYSS